MKNKPKETSFDRAQLLRTVETNHQVWDILIIGGGATGLGVALDASSRGLSTLLLEQSDFAKGTSSRSTKLAHGGVRYLQQGNIKLVFEALHERNLMFQNAPHLVTPLRFLVPYNSLWERFYLGTGLKFYDALAGSLAPGRTEHVPAHTLGEWGKEVIAHHPISGFHSYMDGQFDDARLAIAMARTAQKLGATVLNYMRVRSIHHDAITSQANGVTVVDAETGQCYRAACRAIINAT